MANDRFQLFMAMATAAYLDHRQLAWLRVRHVDVGYIGWVNRGNLGDQAMFHLHARGLESRSLRVVPLDQRTRRLCLAHRPKVGTLLLGGGTILGRNNWAEKVRDTLRRVDLGQIAVLGAGVEDAEFGSSRGITTAAGLQRWSEILRTATYVGVRGPQSKCALGKLGIQAEVVGDPALAIPLNLKRRTHAAQNPLLAVNVAAVPDGYAMDSRAHHRDLARLLGAYARDGVDVQFFAMEKGDVKACNELAAEMGISSPTVCRTGAELIALLETASMVISERLHGAILSANVGIPFMLLGYKPKCYDFAHSIEAAEWVLPLEEIFTNHSKDLIDAGLADGVLEVAVRDAIQELRVRFRVAREHVFAGTS